jgi:hypothetical protein
MIGPAVGRAWHERHGMCTVTATDKPDVFILIPDKQQATRIAKRRAEIHWRKTRKKAS